MIQRSTHDLRAAERLNQENEASAMQRAGLARLGQGYIFALVPFYPEHNAKQ